MGVRRQVDLDGGNVLAYGHWGRPVLAFPSEQGPCWQYEERGMVDAVAPLLDAGRIKLYCVDSYDSQSWQAHDVPLEERARRHGFYEWWILERVVPWIAADSGGAGEPRRHRCQLRRLPRGELRAQAGRSLPVAICQSGVYDVSVVGWGERGDSVYFNNPADYVSHLDGDHLDWLRGRVSLVLVCGSGQWEDTTGALEHAPLRRAARREGHPLRGRHLGPRVPARLAVLARPARASPAKVLLMPPHLIGLLLGTEDDWPTAFESLLERSADPCTGRSTS